MEPLPRGAHFIRAKMPSFLSPVTGILLASAGALAGQASGQDARLEAAKQEGKVVWYTSLAVPSTEKLAKMFESAYPGVKVEAHRTGSVDRVGQTLPGFDREGAIPGAR